MTVTNKKKRTLTKTKTKLTDTLVNKSKLDKNVMTLSNQTLVKSAVRMHTAHMDKKQLRLSGLSPGYGLVIDMLKKYLPILSTLFIIIYLKVTQRGNSFMHHKTCSTCINL